MNINFIGEYNDRSICEIARSSKMRNTIALLKIGIKDDARKQNLLHSINYDKIGMTYIFFITIKYSTEPRLF